MTYGFAVGEERVIDIIDEQLELVVVHSAAVDRQLQRCKHVLEREDRLPQQSK